MKVKFKSRRIARRAGGLFVGLRVQFPMLCINVHPEIDSVECHYILVPVSIGMLLWQLDIDFTYSHVIVD